MLPAGNNGCEGFDPSCKQPCNTETPFGSPNSGNCYAAKVKPYAPLKTAAITSIIANVNRYYVCCIVANAPAGYTQATLDPTSLPTNEVNAVD